MSKVSVVIPTIRGGWLLREAVSSVQSQTLNDWELIIVSDGCQEDLSDIEESDQRIRVLRQSNKGVSIARNVGTARAESELIAFLDDDDRMLPNRLLAQCEAMADERFGACHSQFRIIDGDGEISSNGESKETQYRNLLEDDGGVLLTTLTIRKALFEEVGGFNPLLLLSEDLDLLYRVARESTLVFLPEVLTEYRRHEENTSPLTSGGEERKLILQEHLLAAVKRGEVENVKAIRHGMSYVVTGRTERAIRRAHEARVRKNYLAMFLALGLALLLSPVATLKVSLRQTRRSMSRS